jgi:hypothetical protein
MRSEGGYELIKKAIKKLEARHIEHIAAYGEGNERRLTGRHETADINTFTWVKHLIPTSPSNGMFRLQSRACSALSSYLLLAVVVSIPGRREPWRVSSGRPRHREGRQR